MTDITPVGTTVRTADGQEYFLRPRVTSDFCLRALRRLAETRNCEAGISAMRFAEESLKQKEISRSQYEIICSEAAKRMVAREDVTLDKIGDWLQDIEAICITVSVCCDELPLTKAKEVVPYNLEEFADAIGNTLVKEEDAAKN